MIYQTTSKNDVGIKRKCIIFHPTISAMCASSMPVGVYFAKGVDAIESISILVSSEKWPEDEASIRVEN